MKGLKVLLEETSKRNALFPQRLGSKSPASLSSTPRQSSARESPALSDRMSNNVGNSSCSSAISTPLAVVLYPSTYINRIKQLKLSTNWKVYHGTDVIRLTYNGNRIVSAKVINGKSVRDLWMTLVKHVVDKPDATSIPLTMSDQCIDYSNKSHVVPDTMISKP